MNENFYGKIQGFLDSIALTNSIFEYNLGYTFNFYKIDYISDISNSVREHILDSYKSFIQINHRRENSELLTMFESGFSLKEIENWKDNLKKGLPYWFLCNSLKQYHKYSKVSFDYRTIEKVSILVDSFIEYLEGFFYDEKVKAWELNDYFKSELIYFWGGLYYSDYIFSFEEEIYILHLDFVD